jgi:hypothetical protein
VSLLRSLHRLNVSMERDRLTRLTKAVMRIHIY